MKKQKDLLRKEMTTKRNSLTTWEVKEKSGLIAQNLIELAQYTSAGTLLVYLACRQEVDTIPIIKTAWQQNKRVLVPICMPGKKLLLSELHSLEELAVGCFGILEPSTQFLRPVSLKHVNLAILPGLAFDRHGYRLGYGGGYFDRFLASAQTTLLKIGLAYDFQLTDSLPVEEHDITMDIIVTEEKVCYPNHRIRGLSSTPDK